MNKRTDYYNHIIKNTCRLQMSRKKINVCISSWCLKVQKTSYCAHVAEELFALLSTLGQITAPKGPRKVSEMIDSITCKHFNVCRNSY